MKPPKEDYVRVGHKRVHGWLSQLAIDAICKVAETQARLGIIGPVCEIGVHHGRLFILLHLLTRENELSVAWDLFERQDENVDRSGSGDKEIFLKNLLKHGGDLTRVKAETRNSLDLTTQEIIAVCGQHVRLFSIDGGHSAEVTHNDLSLASNSLCEGGVIILDDFFNESWPGVAEGASRLLLEGVRNLYPFAIAGNKVLFTDSERSATEFIHALRGLGDKYICTNSVFFGRDVLVLVDHDKTLRERLATTSVWRTIRGTPIGRLVKRCINRRYP